MLDQKVITFLAVCQQMNFTKAAKQLNLTQPAVSQQIKALENYYQTKLFNYQNNKLQLTKQGEIVKQALTSLHHNELSLLNQLQKEKTTITLKLGATLTVSSYIMPQILPSLLNNHHYRLKMVSHNTYELLTLLDDGKIDFALIEGLFDKQLYDYRLFSQENFCFVVSKNHPLANQTIDVQELLNNNLIIREKGSGSREILEMLLKNHSLQITDFNAYHEVANINTIKALVSQNLGITAMYQMAILPTDQLAFVNCELYPKDINFIWKKHSLFEENYLNIFKNLKQNYKKE